MCPSPMGGSVGLPFLQEVLPFGQKISGFWNKDVEDNADFSKKIDDDDVKDDS